MSTTRPDPFDYQEGDMDNEPGEINNSIPAGAWMEYDSAADWCAARGVKGEPGDRMPMGISERAAELITHDPEAFERRVKECAYARAQKQWDSLHETPESPLCFCGKPHLHGNPTCGRIQCGLSAFPTIADYARMSPSRPIAVMTEHATREGWEGPFVVREYVALPGDKINYHAIESGDGVCTCGRESRYLAEQDCQALNAAFALGCAVGHELGEVVRGVTSTPDQVFATEDEAFEYAKSKGWNVTPAVEGKRP